MDSLPLHLCTLHTSATIINRSHAFFHSMALLALLYYRASSFYLYATAPSHLLTWLLVFASELFLSFLWLLSQAYQWRPVTRTVFPETFPEDRELGAIDVFICTADPKKEPPVKVMNTVLSAMALDYPPEKVVVYLSDDGGSSLTLNAIREAWRFARLWIPFCKAYGIRTRCPEAYFSKEEEEDDQFVEEREKIKRNYELFKERVVGACGKDEVEQGVGIAGHNHPPLIEVIRDDNTVNEDSSAGHPNIPLLVYVSREKRPSHPHHFKAGALNTLLRVSGIISNAPHVLVLDCDFFCNDPSSARQAMCFHLDSKISCSLAFVQFPQKFHNFSMNDIYDGRLRSVFEMKCPGMDGHQGPMLSGTCFYIKRAALYGNVGEVKDPLQLKQYFGPSNGLIKSLGQSYPCKVIEDGSFSTRLQQETQFLASCSYEEHTKWGEEIGFLYNSVLEDYFTGFILHCKGWNSIYYSPPRPAFLGTATSNLNDTLVQGRRWYCGLLQVTFSRFCPPIYGLLRMSFLESMCYAHLALNPFSSFCLWCLATIPQLCLLNGIPIYPKASDSWFVIFSFVFFSSLLKHLKDVHSTGGSVQTWWNEERIWMMKSITSHFYGSLDGILKSVGMGEASFTPTNKAIQDDQVKLYQMGIFDFRTSTVLLAPLVTLVIFNMISLVGGVGRVMVAGCCDKLLGQIFLSFFIVAVNYPVIEGMILRRDKGRIPPSVALLSLALSMLFLISGSMVLMS
ncbi:hypothetical protein VitviT2T_006656 [Vitis vinifera]|uniref:Cellulose synthase-like protein G2 n=1 Tax=Vitis vinifera TaxID=29760 RepID=A0ABY9BZ23_VITVI|nr:cellulose synthase A catalytic subunit 7 [UDP-forming] [Vitis vinifera]WJZ87260.1 hypothetical protein VitviT2T_006656 [Vitis vinifera]|eukprot:XP_010650048.1 PREDICTED: cellulose synthase A catalytic subunit 7 [UDP-forming] [Vitis vinifera]